MKRLLLASAFVFGVLLFHSTSMATVMLTAYQDGGNVTVDIGGSLDLTGLDVPTDTTGLFVRYKPDVPEFGRASGALDVYSITAVPFGGSGGTSGAFGSGSGKLYFNPTELYLTDGYTSGLPISLSLSVSGKSLSDFNWTVGDQQVIATLPNDEILFEVVGIPEPASMGLFVLSASMMLACKRRRS